MKCVCGYDGYASDYTLLQELGVLYVSEIADGFKYIGEDKMVYACPVCGTLKIEVDLPEEVV